MVKVGGNPEIGAEEASEFAKGFFAGMGLNWLWEFFDLPGFGVPAFKIGDVPEAKENLREVFMGVDDIVQLVISGAVTYAGYHIGRRDVMWFGIGMVVGTLFTKIGDFRKVVMSRFPSSPSRSPPKAKGRYGEVPVKVTE